MGTNRLHRISSIQDIRNAPESETVCCCAGVTKADIFGAVGKGASCLAGIKAATDACTQGPCRQTSPRGC